MGFGGSLALVRGLLFLFLLLLVSPFGRCSFLDLFLRRDRWIVIVLEGLREARGNDERSIRTTSAAMRSSMRKGVMTGPGQTCSAFLFLIFIRGSRAAGGGVSKPGSVEGKRVASRVTSTHLVLRSCGRSLPRYDLLGCVKATAQCAGRGEGRR